MKLQNARDGGFLDSLRIIYISLLYWYTTLFAATRSYYVSSVPGHLIVLCTYILTCLNVLRDHVLACPPNLACIRDRVLSSLCVNMPRCQHSHVPTCLWNLHVDVPCMSTCLNNCVSMYLISTASYHSGINSWQGN